MGPVRGTKKKKKKKKKLEDNAYHGASGSSEKEGPLDWWDDLLRKTNGLDTPSKSLDNFESVFKISRRAFEYIYMLVGEDMQTKSSAHLVFASGRPMSVRDQVAVALRRLGSGDSLVATGDRFGLSHSAVSQATWRFVESMESRGLSAGHLRWPSTRAQISDIKSKFERMRGFPGCCGAVDATHVLMSLPAADPTRDAWLDPEHNHSMVLQAVVDPDMRFLDVAAGWPGKMSHGSVFESSALYGLCERGEVLNGGGPEIREYLVGDSGYPLLPYLVVPYESRELSRSEFNERLSETRAVAERALARLKDTWRIIGGPMWRPDKHRLPRIILVCCLLHNIVIDTDNEIIRDNLTLSRDHDPGYRQQVCRTADVAGVVLRDKLSLYLSGRFPP